MFLSEPRPKLAQRALGAVRLARSLLLLEDDYEVDWEVGQDERAHWTHPHRAPLRSRLGDRRPGAPRATAHVCVSPVGRGPLARRGARDEQRPSCERLARTPAR